MNTISSLESATAVVTGATGFIGSHLVDYLIEH
ncbi:MAG: NAD-dependent epimerase/dehydratase family protein, partial [Nitrospinaceae bacterium]|nr:NAD-dependent epimerase/dehydratase family protein [Nitrospinaceae bacterium]